MIRPSGLSLAEKCSHFVELAAAHPETSEGAERGSLVDAQNTAYLLGAVPPTDKDSVACLREFARIAIPGGKLHAQEKVQLLDPETGALLTEGTPDVQQSNGTELLTVDWKKREQWYAGNLTGPDDNLQLHAYSLARGLALGVRSYRNVLIIFGDGKAEALPSRVFEHADWWPLIDRIKAIQARPRLPAPGQHCQGCYQRWVCPSYRERARLALAVLPAEGQEIGPLTDAQAGELALRAQAVKAAADLALDMAKAHFRSGGAVSAGGKRYVPTQMPGRTTADVGALERDGMTKYLRGGAGYERWTWRKA